MPIYQNSEKLEIVVMETKISQFADVEGQFDPERLGYSHQMAQKLKLNGLANLLVKKNWPHLVQFPW